MKQGATSPILTPNLPHRYTNDDRSTNSTVNYRQNCIPEPPGVFSENVEGDFDADEHGEGSQDETQHFSVQYQQDVISLASFNWIRWMIDAKIIILFDKFN